MATSRATQRHEPKRQTSALLWIGSRASATVTWVVDGPDFSLTADTLVFLTNPWVPMIITSERNQKRAKQCISSPGIGISLTVNWTTRGQFCPKPFMSFACCAVDKVFGGDSPPRCVCWETGHALGVHTYSTASAHVEPITDYGALGSHSSHATVYASAHSPDICYRFSNCAQHWRLDYKWSLKSIA